MGEVIDLDALVPESRIVKIGGKEIEIPPPKTQQVMELGVLGQSMQGVDPKNVTEVTEMYNKMSDIICKIVPDLSGIDLVPEQVIALFEIITEMATPKNATELAKRGIDTNTPKAP